MGLNWMIIKITIDSDLDFSHYESEIYKTTAQIFVANNKSAQEQWEWVLGLSYYI